MHRKILCMWDFFLLTDYRIYVNCNGLEIDLEIYKILYSITLNLRLFAACCILPLLLCEVEWSIAANQNTRHLTMVHLQIQNFQLCWHMCASEKVSCTCAL